MTVSNPQIRVSYVGDGTSTAFPIPFPFYDDTDIGVFLGTAPQSAGYSISGGEDANGNPQPGTLTFSTPPAAQVAVQAILDVPLTQLVNLVDGTAFPSSTINQVNDRSIQAALRLADRLSRTILAPDGDVAPGMALPAAGIRANTFLGFDVNGNVLLGQTLPSGTLSQSTIGLFLYPRTAAEIAAGVTPANYAYAPLDTRRYGLVAGGAASTNIAAINNASLVANSGGGGIVLIPPGNITINASIQLRDSVIFQGAGSGYGIGPTVISYSGSGFGMVQTTPGTRIYGVGIRDLLIVNTGTGTLGIDLDSVSTSELRNVIVSSFTNAIRLHSTTNGGCVYNRFYNVTAQMPASAGLGFNNDTLGSNANHYFGCRYNGQGSTSGTAWNFTDSNGNSVVGCDIDGALNGFTFTAPSGAGFTDSNNITCNRLENVATVFNFGTNTRYNHVFGNYYQNIPTAFLVDNGTANNIVDPPFNCIEQIAGVNSASGNRRFINFADNGANPFFSIENTASGTAGAVALQILATALNGNFLNCKTAGTTYFTLNNSGQIVTYGGVNAPTGFGTPTGPAVINNFPGATATLVQTSETVAEILKVLLNLGVIAA